MDDDLPYEIRSASRSMDTVEDRIASFTNWPHGGGHRPIFMADAGFYQHSLDTDAVLCFNCKVFIEGWNRRCDPITEHRRAAPDCSWNNNTYMTSWDERFTSFRTWPLDVKPLPAAMALAGFYHSNKSTDAVTCFSCKLILKDWKQQDDPIQRHLQQPFISRPCPWISKVTNQPSQTTPPTPPITPPMPAPGVPHMCDACQETFPSGTSFRKHRRRYHKNIGRRIGVPLKKSKVAFMERHKVSKATTQRMRRGRRNNTNLFV